MNFRTLVELSIFLRPLNFLRVKSEYTKRYCWDYPIALSFVGYLLTTVTRGDQAFALASDKLLSLITLLIPFYIASLAAISTLPETGPLNEPFKTRKEISLRILSANDTWKDIILSPKDYMRLLFAYATFASICIFCLIAGSNAIFSLFGLLSMQLEISAKVFLYGVIYLFSAQLATITLIGIYFLSDYLVRIGHQA